MKPSITSLLLIAGLLAFQPSRAAVDSIALSDTVNNWVIFNFSTPSKTETQNHLLAAYSYQKNGFLKEAETCYRQVLGIYMKLNNQAGSATVALRLSEVLFQKKNYVEGLKYANYAAINFQKAGLKNETASAYLILAAIHHILGDYGRAEQYILKQSLPLFRSAGNARGRLTCFDRLGHIYFSQQRYSEAKWFFIQQKTLAHLLKDTSAIVNALLYLGKVKNEIKDYDLALSDFKEADLLAKMAGLKTDPKAVSAIYKTELATKITIDVPPYDIEIRKKEAKNGSD